VKRARIINKGKPESSLSDVGDESAPVINKEIIKARPVKFTDNGITAFQRNTKPTEEGLETEQHKPVLFDGRGRHINSESDLQGECHVCHRYVSQIYYCCVQGCKILLCEEHIYFFEEDGKKLPCCIKHHNDFVMNRNTWPPKTREGKR
jgi:hypothetical protein